MGHSLTKPYHLLRYIYTGKRWGSNVKVLLLCPAIALNKYRWNVEDMGVFERMDFSVSSDQVILKIPCESHLGK